MSICIDCKKGADKCEWLFRLRPIRGWNSTKVRCGSFVTYDVTACPNFEKNRTNKRIRRTKSEIAAAARLAQNDTDVSEVSEYGA